jgi:hypothetical protein
MRHLAWSALVAMLVTLAVAAQDSVPSQSQSARQALIEMFMGKGTDDFTRHLPDDARQMLIHKGETPETSIALRIASIGREMANEGGRLETFDNGPNILVSQQPDGHERIEVAVERDTLLDDGDEIELSVHLYKDGEPQSLPVVPRLIFALKQEKEVWRLTEVTVAAHVPLTDPDYLKGLRKEQDESNERAAQSRMFIITQAEANYAASHKDSGYTCILSALFPQPDASNQAAAYYPGNINEESNGYRFALTGCQGNPALKYRLSAVPVDPGAEIKAFCADESGTIKSIAADNKSSCFSRGEAINSGAPPAVPTVE